METLEARRLLAADVLGDDSFREMSSLLANRDPGEIVGGLVDTFSSIREQVSTVMQTAGNLPIIGDQITAGIQPFLDDLSKFESQLTDKIDGIYAAGTDLIVGAVRDGLFEIFGPPGLKVLQDNGDAGNTIGKEDIVVTTFDGDSILDKGLQFDFHLGQTIFTDLEFSIGSDMEELLPFFDFKLDASDGIRFQLSWDLYFGFGFSVGDEAADFDFFINTDAKTSIGVDGDGNAIFGDDVAELSARVDVFSAPPKDAAGKDLVSNKPGISADVSLGILSAHIEDGTEKRISLTGTDPVPLPNGILQGHDFTNSVDLEIHFDDAGTIRMATIPIDYVSPGNESFATFLQKLNVEIDEGLKGDNVPIVLRRELFPISVRPQIMLGLDAIESQVAGGDPSQLDVPVALLMNARTPLIKAMTLRPRGASADLTKWGFQAGGQSDDDRAIGLGFRSGSGPATSMTAIYDAPIDGKVMGDTDFILEYGATMARVVIRKSMVPEFDDSDPSNPPREQYRRFVQNRVNDALSQAGVLTPGVTVSMVNGKFKLDSDRPIKVTYSVLDKTSAQILAEIDIQEPSTGNGDGRLSLVRELSGAKLTDIFAPKLQASAQVRMAVEASTDAVTKAIAQAIGASDSALELPSLTFDFKVDASIVVDASTTGRKDLKPDIEVKFDNVALDIGPVLDTIVKPIANFVGETLGPVADILGDGVDAAAGFINEPIPVVSDIVGGDVSIVDIAPNGQKINDTLGTVSALLGLGSSISSFLETYDGQPINFGCFALDRRAKFPIPCEVVDTFDDLDLGGGEQPDASVAPPRIEAANGATSWNVTGLKKDTEYIVSAAWNTNAANASAAKYTISGATTNPPAVTFDQRTAPTDDFAGGEAWKELGRITTSPSANGTVLVVVEAGAGNAGSLVVGNLRFTEVPEPAVEPANDATDDEPDTSVANSSKKKKKSSSASFLEKFSEFNSSSPLSLDIIQPTSIMNMLTGQPFDIISINVPAINLPLGLDFNFDLGPISANFAVGADIEAVLGFGYDSTGIQQIIDAFSSGAEPDFSDLLDGFYVRNQVGEELRVDLTASGGGSIGPVPGFWPINPLLDARAQIEIGGGIGLDLQDPNEDGRLRFDELLHVTDNFRSPENLLCIFDIGLNGSFDLNASVTILGVTLGTDDLPFPTSFEFSLSASQIFGALGFDCDGRIAPILAEPMMQDGENVLRINAGAFASNRLFGGPVLPDSSPSVLEADRAISDVNGIKVLVSGDRDNVIVDFPDLLTREGNAFDLEKRRQTYRGPFDRIIIVGEEGDDEFDFSALTGVPVSASGAGGNDRITGGSMIDVLMGDTGNDTIIGGGGDDSIFGGEGDDNLLGGDGNDVILGEAGKDTIDGQAGNDTIEGGRDDDDLSGGMGNDQILGGSGNDRIKGDAGNDRLLGESGHDVISGGEGDDDLLGGIGNDRLEGDAGRDTVSGGVGIDLVAGGTLTIDENGTVTAMVADLSESDLAGARLISRTFVSTGDNDQDTVSGDEGDDYVVGEIFDFLFGRKGSDTLFVGLGAQWADGGAGNDVIEYNLVHPTEPGGAVDAELRRDRLIGLALQDSNAGVLDTERNIKMRQLSNTVTIITGIEEFRSANFGDGPDRFTVAGTPAPLTITMRGGVDTLTVTGADHELIADAGDEPGDLLVIDVSADTTARGGQISAAAGTGTNRIHVDGLGLISAADKPSIDANNFQNLRVFLGQGADTLTVNKATFFDSQLYYGNDGDDQFFVTPDDASFGASKRLEIFGDAGNDVANILIDMLLGEDTATTSTTPVLNPSLQQWGVTIDTLRIDNSGGNTAETWELRDQDVYVDNKIILSAIGAGTTLFRGNQVTGTQNGAIEDQLIITDSPASKKTISVEGDIVSFQTGKNVLSPQLQLDGRTHDITSLSPNGYVGLSGVLDIATAPDGRYLYVTSSKVNSDGSTSHLMVVYERNVDTGDLRFIQEMNYATLIGGAGDQGAPKFIKASNDNRLVFVATNTHIHTFVRESTGRLRRTMGVETSSAIAELLIHPTLSTVYARVGSDVKNGTKIDSFQFDANGQRGQFQIGNVLRQTDERIVRVSNSISSFPFNFGNQNLEIPLDLHGRQGARPAIAEGRIYWIDGNNLNSYQLDPVTGMPGSPTPTSIQISSDEDFGFGEVSQILVDGVSDKLIFTSEPTQYSVRPIYQTVNYAVTTDYFFYETTQRFSFTFLVDLDTRTTPLGNRTFVIDLNGTGGATGNGGGTIASSSYEYVSDLEFTDADSLIGRTSSNRLVNVDLNTGTRTLSRQTTGVTLGDHPSGLNNSLYFAQGGQLVSRQGSSVQAFNPGLNSAGNVILDSTAASGLHSVVSCNGGNIYALDPNTNSLLRFRKANEFEDSPLVLMEEFVDGFTLSSRDSIDTLSSAAGVALTGTRNTNRVDGLQGANSITVSDDGRWVYVASPGEGKIAVFRLGDAVTDTNTNTFALPATDRLQFVGTLDYTGVHTVALTDDFDQTRLLAIGSTPDQFAVWNREAVTGVVDEGSRSIQIVPGLGTPTDIIGSLDFVRQASPGLIVTESDQSTVVTEPDVTDSITVALKTRPTDTVFVDVSESTSSGPAVQFRLTREFTVDVENQRLILPAHGFSVGDTLTVSSTGTLPGGLSDAADVSYVVIAADFDSIEIEQVGTSGTTLTNFGSGFHTLRATVRSGYLVFTPANFSTPQTVEVLSINDSFGFEDRMTSIALASMSGDFAYDGLSRTVPVTVVVDTGGKLIV